MDARIAAAATTSAFGRGLAALRDGLAGGTAAFRTVDRFGTAGRRVAVAAAHPGSPVLRTELEYVIGDACDRAGLGTAERAACPLLLAIHGDPVAPRAAERLPAGAFAASLAHATGLGPFTRAYTSACVAGTSALADAAAMVTTGGVDRVVVAAGYLVESDQFALFDAGRALAIDGAVRPFSAERTGIVLGDAVVAIVVESPRPAGPGARAARLPRRVGPGRGRVPRGPAAPGRRRPGPGDRRGAAPGRGRRRSRSGTSTRTAPVRRRATPPRPPPCTARSGRRHRYAGQLDEVASTATRWRRPACWRS